MLFSEKERNPKEALGLFVDLMLGDEDRYQYTCEKIMPYRTAVQIWLPPAHKKDWVSGILDILCEVEGENAWPVRLDHENVFAFLSQKDLERIDGALSRVTMYVYNAPVQATFDEESYRRWRNASQRAAYLENPVRSMALRKIC